MDKPLLSADLISKRLHSLDLPVADGVVGILRGGLVPAFLLAHQLGGLPVRLLGLNLRDDANAPLREEPRLTLPIDLAGWKPGMRLLLVDDVSVSGKTMQVAMRYLEGYVVTTVALKGRADHVAFPEVHGCVRWPWHA